LNESGFKQAINKHVKTLSNNTVYVWGIADKFTSGIPDCYYSGTKDMWIEYKYGKTSYGATPQQKQWLIDQHQRGRLVALIHGYDNYIVINQVVDGIILPSTSFKTKKETAQWILTQLK
jgi:hypothetical protein